MKHLQPDRPECKEKLEKILQQIHWPHFPGVQALLLKGCTNPQTAEATWCLLSKLTILMNAPVIDPTNCDGEPLFVMSQLELPSISNYEIVLISFISFVSIIQLHVLGLSEIFSNYDSFLRIIVFSDSLLEL